MIKWPYLKWRLTSVGNIVVVDRSLDGLNVSSNVELLDGLMEVLDSRVSEIIVSKDLDSLLDLVGSVDVLNSQDGDGVVVTRVAESNALVDLQGDAVDIVLGDIQVNWNRPEGAVGETEIIDNAVKFGAKLEFCRLRYAQWFLASFD